MTRLICFAVPDEGEWVAVPVEVIDTIRGIANSNWRQWEELASPDEFERWVKSRAAHATLLAASPPCRVVELPERCDVAAIDGDYGQGRIDGYNEYRDEIERRANLESR